MLCKEISLCIMTRELCHELYKSWENDPAIYMEMDLFAPYQYNETAVNRYFDSKQDPSRILFAIMRDGRPIGELQLKQIDPESKECTLSIHMQNDTVKGLGYGTYAEKLALKYAFDVLGMAVVNADTVIKNTRSQHVLEKIGFQLIGERDGFKYYRCVR
ncbi:MAG: GNAT family N-acetyltransferase [Lachnospiraceae bacterium]|nr:GNAT family N-acetyltransferase [Lachnospiraceae bacterium]